MNRQVKIFNGFKVIINPAPYYVVFSRTVPDHGKASERRHSHSMASFDNAAREQAQCDLSLKSFG